MKKVWSILLSVLMLAGCSSGKDLETLGSVPQQPSTFPSPAQVLLELPEGAVTDVFGSEEEASYSCDGYSISMKTLEAGDLKATIQDLTGYDPENLSVMESASGKADRYDFVWTATAEQGDLIGRAAVIDDGSFHYCLSVLTEAANAGSLAEEWNDLFGSFCLEAA